MTKKVKENAENPTEAAEGILNDPKPMVTYDTHKSTIMHRKMQFPFFMCCKNRSEQNFYFWKLTSQKSPLKIRAWKSLNWFIFNFSKKNG